MIDQSQPDTQPALKKKVERYIAAADWLNAELASRQLCELLSYSLGADHLEVAMALHQLAFVLEAQGKIEEAGATRERTSEILLNQKPNDHS